MHSCVGLTAKFEKCTDRIETEVAKLQTELNLCAKEEGLLQMQGSVSRIDERLQDLSSQQEQDVQDLHTKIDALSTSTENLRYSVCSSCRDGTCMRLQAC